MPSYGVKSTSRLSTCHLDLRVLMLKVVETFDNSILEGYRDEVTQNRYYDEGKSHLRWPEGKHNKKPSLAVDAVPYPVDWDDRERMALFAGFVLGTAKEMGIGVRWGGDWNQNWVIKDSRFVDMPHFELLE